MPGGFRLDQISIWLERGTTRSESLVASILINNLKELGHPFGSQRCKNQQHAPGITSSQNILRNHPKPKRPTRQVDHSLCCLLVDPLSTQDIPHNYFLIHPVNTRTPQKHLPWWCDSKKTLGGLLTSFAHWNSGFYTVEHPTRRIQDSSTYCQKLHLPLLTSRRWRYMAQIFVPKTSPTSIGPWLGELGSR